MTAFTFADEYRYSGNKAVAKAEFTAIRPTVVVEMTLDTGAEISLLNREFAGILRINIEDGVPVELVVANNEGARAYVHPVELELLGRQLTVQAAFCPDWDTKNLLGMRGFFDQMVVAFDHARRRIYF